jgi:hypothetical protein
VEGFCEHGNEPSRSAECWGNSSVAVQLAASQEDMISLKLVILTIPKLEK